MNARTLTDVLLELNVINIKDMDREINRLAASLYDPRAAAWFKRVARHWLINIDWLQKPYEVPAVPRNKALGGRGAEWYAKPSIPSGLVRPAWHGEQPPNKPNICEICKGEGQCRNCEGTGRVGQDQECPKCGGSGRCPACTGTGLDEKPYAGGHPCPKCQGSGVVKVGPAGLIPAKKNDPEADECEKCHGTGIFEPYEYKRPPGREGFFAGEALVRRLLDEADPDYDPKKRTYTTNLHVNPKKIECPDCISVNPTTGEKIGPDANCPTCHGTGETRQRIAKDIDQNFSRFHPKKAKTKRLHGDPPTKAELQPFMKGPEAEEKEFYHFDPIQVRRRDLFNRLQDLVNFINYAHRALQRPPQLSAEDMEDLLPNEIKHLTQKRQQNLKDAQALFKQLEIMKPDDINGFRAILRKAEEFTNKVKNDPLSFMTKKSGKVLARQGDLVLRRCNEKETALICGQKPKYKGVITGSDGRPKSWCLSNTHNVTDYIENGPIFYIEKNGKAYIGIHPASEQCKDAYNIPLESTPNGEAMAEEIAPLLVNLAADISVKSLRNDARHLSDLVHAMRMEAGIR